MGRTDQQLSMVFEGHNEQLQYKHSLVFFVGRHHVFNC